MKILEYDVLLIPWSEMKREIDAHGMWKRENVFKQVFQSSVYVHSS